MVDETALFYGGRQERNQQIIMFEEIYPRPQSVINIVEIPDSSEANPQPVNDTEKPLGEFISTQKLKELGGVNHLFDLHELTVKVDTSETSIGNVGSMAPNLRKLNLNNSFITSVRDLGTSLNNLNTLWLSRCCLQELDGISGIGTLKELFVAYNEIFDLSPLSMMENLEVLDLEGNNVDDVTQVEFLTLCSKLRVLTLKGNPMEHSPTPTTDTKDLKFYSYRDAVLSCLPELNMLDDERFLEEIVNGTIVKRNNEKAEKEEMGQNLDYQIICDSLKTFETIIPDEPDIQESSTNRPLSARLRYQSAKSTQNKNLRYQSAKSTQNKNASNVSPRSPGRKDEALFEISELTHGMVLCGNPVQALCRKIRENKQKVTSKNIKKKPTPIFKPEHSYLSTEEDAMEKDDVLDQLKLWRSRNQSLFEDEVDLSFTPTKKKNNSSVSSPVYSPSPPSTPKPPQTSSRTRRSLGVERSPGIERPTLIERPSTAADFRSTAGIESDLVVTELEIIDENNSISVNNAVVSTSITHHQDLVSRPSTARAALRTTQYVVQETQDDT